MFGLGMGELLVILAIALIVIGPKKLPDLASSLGKAIRSFRKATRELTDQLEVDDAVKQPFQELRAALRDEPAAHPGLATQLTGAEAIAGPAVASPGDQVAAAQLPSIAPAAASPPAVAEAKPTDKA